MAATGVSETEASWILETGATPVLLHGDGLANGARRSRRFSPIPSTRSGCFAKTQELER